MGSARSVGAPNPNEYLLSGRRVLLRVSIDAKSNGTKKSANVLFTRVSSFWKNVD